MNDAAPSSRVPILTKVTLAYSEDEDRIRLDGADIEGITQTLWLTARLLNRLVPHLITRQGDTQLFLGNLDATHTPDEPESAGEKTQMVRCAPGSPETLVMSVDLSAQESQLVLVFLDSEGARCAALAMPYEALKQWNCGLKRCFELAGWPQQIFQHQSQGALKVGRGEITVH